MEQPELKAQLNVVLSEKSLEIPDEFELKFS
jgi:hypothetical protein